MRKKHLFFIVSFFLLLSLLAIFVIVTPAKEFSENENRVLAQKPTFSLEEVLSGNFQENLSDYLSDQIPLRDAWIQINTEVKKWLGQKEINDVYMGKEHYYFQQFTDESYSTSRMNAIFQMIEDWTGKIKNDTSKEIQNVSVMLVPTPGTILRDKLPSNAPYYDEDVVYKKAQDTLSCNFIDMREVFSQNAEHTQLYYKTDHHWTGDGAYLAYVEYCKSIGMDAKEQSYFQIEELTDSFYGTLYSKVLDWECEADHIYAPQNLPEVEVICDDEKISESVYDLTYLEQKDKYCVFFGGNWEKVQIKTSAENGKRLLLIKDSFANSFVPYILEDYEEIVMIDLRYYGGTMEEILSEYEITDVLFLYETTNLLTDTGIIKLNSN